MCGKTKTQGGYHRFCSGVQETVTRYHRDTYCDKPHHQRLRCEMSAIIAVTDAANVVPREEHRVISPLVSLSAAAQQRLQVPYSGLSAKDFHSALINPLVQGRSQRSLPGPTGIIPRPSTTMQTRPHGPGSSPSVRIVLQQRPQAPYESPPPVGSQSSTISMRQARPQRQQPGSGSQQPTANPDDVNIRRPQISDEAPSSNDSERSRTTVTEEGSLVSDGSLTTITQSRSLSPPLSISSGRVHQALSARKRNRD
ncbi:hypothetical protein EPUS_02562 [Endocarpon pusillum Z07020]|uniref:Uncharacterized protein n=1 Tax=Endocarpon pusillum (strain Z07020 / HMAS-L-300199) TaxID=1263415 RepID=U1GG19_ENDPU|nr:uncharacterized protein EPUS_02562 [Endocarpon pusillum Z07020]ERF70696.1 hypothetical protein EPUS_02562 [Endocarpon pusillum Z07020]